MAQDDAFANAAAQPLSVLTGLGKSLLAALEKAGFRTLVDLWFHFPLRHEDRTGILRVGELRAGVPAQFVATVDHSEVGFRRRRALLVSLGDGSGRVLLRFFHFKQAQADQLKAGARVLVYGKPRAGGYSLELVHPRYRVLGADEQPVVEDSLRPVYPQTEGLGNARLQRAVELALERLPEGDDGLLAGLLPRQWPCLADAIRSLHRPRDRRELEAITSGVHPARARLAFEELLAHHLSLRLVRQRVRSERSPVLRASGRLRRQLLATLPFTLTGAQVRVLAEIDADLGRSAPMLRLLQGDVGSGKTIVAALAALAAIESGMQAAVMAPTELLAEQHRRSFERWFAPLGIEGVWLSSRIQGKVRARALTRLAEGAPWAVGTHALMQEAVCFRALGLAIIDEQHRFGVDQRLAFAQKGGVLRPHQLVMTATPIPRTLAMTEFADLDVSVIDELPPGRKPVQTVAVSRARRDEVVQRIVDACAGGRQAYWVCTLIDESEEIEAEAAAKTASELTAALPRLRVGLVHSRLKAGERADVMRDFAAGELDLLVATTVIEVGVDVPRASLMIVENPERLGLAQLHQLRGRVGRGVEESSCVLLYQPPLSTTAHERLSVLRRTSDGFAIAERDLELRGPGEVLGTRQTGATAFRVADLTRDAGWLARVREVADRLLEQDVGAAEALVRRWVGASARYAKA
ncbi:MAG: ATP-dependent DNA helicase RecG [Lysobacterales bacterium]|nr:ATP-dependent DNA helicase RecG [Xanthomonadales bacterium]